MNKQIISDVCAYVEQQNVSHAIYVCEAPRIGIVHFVFNDRV